VTPQLLSNSGVFPIGVQERSKRVPESVISHMLRYRGALQRRETIVAIQRSRPQTEQDADTLLEWLLSQDASEAESLTA
jgi:hypothetical protein